MTFDEWLKTDEGKKCNDEWTIADSKGYIQPWLRNRLWWAFDAGSKSKEQNKIMASHIKELHGYIKKLKKEIREQKKFMKIKS